MKMTLEEHAARFDEMAAEYDQNKSEECRACAALVIEHASPRSDDVLVDLGCGTGAIGLALASDVKRVIGRDISQRMLDRARVKADERGLANVDFGYGSLREPNISTDASVDIVVSNFAMHHLNDEEKREALRVLADLNPRRFMLGDVMLFGEPDPEEPVFDHDVDDPATVGMLAHALTDFGFALTAVEMVHKQYGVLVAEGSVDEKDG